jgi:hypothetical protein
VVSFLYSSCIVRTHRNPLCLGVGFDEVGGPAEGQEQLTLHHRLYMELDLQSLFGLHVLSFTY